MPKEKHKHTVMKAVSEILCFSKYTQQKITFAYANILNYILNPSRWHTLAIQLLQTALSFPKYPPKEQMRAV